MLKSNLIPDSLARRFKLHTVVLGLISTAVGAWLYVDVLTQREAVSHQVDYLEGQMEQLRKAQTKQISLQNAIVMFLLDPTIPGLRDNIEEYLDEIISLVTDFRDNELATHGHDLGADGLIVKLTRYQSINAELMRVRTNVREQYPSMALSAFQMGPVQTEINEKLSVLQTELEADGVTAEEQKVYVLVLKTRTSWALLISQMRIYLANRLASFSTDILRTQARSAEEIAGVFEKQVAELRQLYQGEVESFEGEAALEKISDALKRWVRLFSQMRGQSESSQWRQDWSLMEKQVIPAQQEITHDFAQIEQRLRQEGREVSNVMDRYIDKVFLVMAASILAVVAFMITTLISLNVMVFQPIMAVATALRERAFQRLRPVTFEKRSEEIDLLVEAFEEMDKQVNDRQQALEFQAQQLLDYQSELERKVDQRTEKLKEVNDNLSTTLSELQNTQNQLIENEKMAALGAMVAGISHEISTPIGISITSVSSLEEDLRRLEGRLADGSLKRSELEDFLKLVRQAGSIQLSNLMRASDLIRSFKQVAVDQSEEIDRTFDLREYIDEVLLSLRPQFKHRAIRIDNDCEAGIVLDSKPGAIYQVLSNLLLNSLAHGYGPEDEGHIRIGARREGGSIVIDYRDDGKGIDPQHLKQVFEPFFTTKRGRGGTGLGLSIVYSIVKHKLNGNIQLESRPGEGVSFHISFPLAA